MKRIKFLVSTILRFCIGIVLLLSLHACIEPKAVRSTHYYYIANTTGKRIIHQLICNTRYVDKEMFEFYSDGSTHQLEFEWEVVEKFSSWHAMMPTVLSTFLYNIDDTTAFKTRNIGGENAKFLVIANEHETSTDDEIQYMSDYQLTVNDSLLLLMQKDYTMLEKFSEYYQQ